MPFQPGVSGNPAGRPRGARNKMTLLLETLVQEDLEAIVRCMNDRAKEGNVGAAKLCLNVFGTRRSRPVTCDLPDVNTPQDVLAAMKIIIADVAKGELTPLEGNEVSNLIQRYVEMYGNFHFEKRLREVECRRMIQARSASRPVIGPRSAGQPMIEPPRSDTQPQPSESSTLRSASEPPGDC